jgi:hypothetical protein
MVCTVLSRPGRVRWPPTPRRQAALGDVADELDAVHARHVEVDQQHVRRLARVRAVRSARGRRRLETVRCPGPTAIAAPCAAGSRGPRPPSRSIPTRNIRSPPSWPVPAPRSAAPSTPFRPLRTLALIRGAVRDSPDYRLKPSADFAAGGRNPGFRHSRPGRRIGGPTPPALRPALRVRRRASRAAGAGSWRDRAKVAVRVRTAAAYHCSASSRRPAVHSASASVGGTQLALLRRAWMSCCHWPTAAAASPAR